MLEFLLLGIVGMGVGLRFTAMGAAMLGMVVIAASIALAMVMNATFDARLTATALSVLGFNLGLVWGLTRDRRRGGVDTARVEPAPTSMDLARPGPHA